MKHIKELKEFRSEAIAKLTLLKSSYKLSIEAFPTPLLDFFVALDDYPDVTFAIEVKPIDNFTRQLDQQKHKMEMYRDTGLINMPVIVMRIDDVKEAGQLDFLVEPVASGELRLKHELAFKPLNVSNLDQLIGEIINWKKRRLQTPA